MATKTTEYLVTFSTMIKLEKPSRSPRRLWRQLAEALPGHLTSVVPDLLADDAVNELIDQVERLSRDREGYQITTPILEE